MFKKDKLFSLLLVALMICAAAISVNKSIFGQKIESQTSVDSEDNAVTDTVTVLSADDVVVHTSSLPGGIAGYAGPVDLDIHIKNGKIADIIPLQNAESPGFFDRAKVLLNAWIGKTPQEALDMNVDAVSGATYSSDALIHNTRLGLEYYTASAPSSRGSRDVPWKIWVALAVTLSACIFPLFVRSRIYHNVQLIANVLVLGFWCGTFLDYALILKYMSDGLILPLGLVAIAMLVAAFIYPLFGHPQHYCNHICPLGSAQQLMAEICGYKIKISKGVLKGLDWFRRILWAVLMLLLWGDCFTSWMDLELFQAFQFESASWWIIGVAVAFVALSAVIARPYCRFVCPTGSLFKRAEDMG